MMKPKLFQKQRILVFPSNHLLIHDIRGTSLSCPLNVEFIRRPFGGRYTLPLMFQISLFDFSFLSAVRQTLNADLKNMAKLSFLELLKKSVSICVNLRLKTSSPNAIRYTLSSMFKISVILISNLFRVSDLVLRISGALRAPFLCKTNPILTPAQNDIRIT